MQAENQYRQMIKDPHGCAVGVLVMSSCHASPVRDARLPFISGWWPGLAPLPSPSFQSIRAAHNGSGASLLSRLACSRRAASFHLRLVSGACAPSLAFVPVHPRCSQRLRRFLVHTHAGVTGGHGGDGGSGTSSQALYRSSRRKRQISLTPLLRLSPSNPLRWALMGPPSVLADKPERKRNPCGTAAGISGNLS